MIKALLFCFLVLVFAVSANTEFTENPYDVFEEDPLALSNNNDKKAHNHTKECERLAKMHHGHHHHFAAKAAKARKEAAELRASATTLTGEAKKLLNKAKQLDAQAAKFDKLAKKHHEEAKKHEAMSQ